MRLALLWALGFSEKDGRIQAKAWRRVWEVRAERGRPVTEGPGALSGCRLRGRGPPGNALRKRVSGASSPLCLQESPASGPPRQELQNLGRLPGPGRRPALQSRAQWGSLLVPYLQLRRLRPGRVPRGHPLAGEGPRRRASPQGAGLLPSLPRAWGALPACGSVPGTGVGAPRVTSRDPTERVASGP